MMGAVVLNPDDLGTQVVVTTQPPNVEETIFGGFSWGFGLIVAVENRRRATSTRSSRRGRSRSRSDSNPGATRWQGTLTRAGQ